MVSRKELASKIVLVGNPNVGKSVIFRLLTGSYVLVSNFPGTTVDVSRGTITLAGREYEVIDTPGVNSLVPQSEDERVTCEILLREKPDLIVQVADAKNLRRTLLVTSQLVEFGRPMVLVLNMMDEAQARGIEVDTQGLRDLFDIPVVETVAIYSQGKRQLLQALQDAKVPRDGLRPDMPIPALSKNGGDGSAVPAALGIEWLSLDDRNFTRWLESAVGERELDSLKGARQEYLESRRRSLGRDIAGVRNGFLDSAVGKYKRKRQARFLEEGSPAATRIWLGLFFVGLALLAWNELGGLLNLWSPYRWSSFLLDRGVSAFAGNFSSASDSGLISSMLAGRGGPGKADFGLLFAALRFLLFIAPVVIPLRMLLTRSRSFTNELGILTRRPGTGIPILLAVMLLVYEFVGYIGAQSLVGLLEEVVFGRLLVPPLRGWLPAGFLRDLIAGQYGLVSMGLTYAVAIVFPVVGTFFIAFSLLEDSGYLPRLSILSDRIMRRMGLNGKATLPMVLGLGCCTMATITTRILNSRKERLITTLLLALGIPCSAQLGVILGISSSFSLGATLTVLGVVAMQLVLVGWVASLLIRGNRSEFMFEIPPIRIPQMRNVLLKTGYRLRWYIVEAIPLFLLGTLALFAMDRLSVGGRSLLVWLQEALAPVLTGVLHLPADAAAIFVLGFLRRDYGAAGLLDMVRNHALTAQQAVVSLIVITLFVPCLASFLVIVREQGVKRALAITGFILPFAIGVGAAVSWILRTLNITFL